MASSVPYLELPKGKAGSWFSHPKENGALTSQVGSLSSASSSPPPLHIDETGPWIWKFSSQWHLGTMEEASSNVEDLVRSSGQREMKVKLALSGPVHCDSPPAHSNPCLYSSRPCRFNWGTKVLTSRWSLGEAGWSTPILFVRQRSGGNEAGVLSGEEAFQP